MFAPDVADLALQLDQMDSFIAEGVVVDYETNLDR